MLIRPVEKKDNEKLIELEKKAGQGEKLRIVTERDDYLFRANKFVDSIIYLAEDETNGEILGVMGVGPVNVTLAGKETKAGYIFDWRSNPEIKSLNRAMYRIWIEIKKEMEARQIRFIFGFVKEDNSRSLNIIQRVGAKPVGEKIFYTLPLFRSFSSSGDQAKIQGKINSWEEYLKVKSQKGTLDFFPHYDNGDWFSKSREAFFAGKISHGDSSLKIWDTTSQYRFRALEIPTFFKMARPVFSFFSPIISLPRIPRKGEAIKNWFLYDFDIRKKEDLPILLEGARRFAMEEEVDFFIFIRDAKETPLDFAERKAWLKVKYKTFFFPFEKLPMPQNPTHYDVSFL